MDLTCVDTFAESYVSNMSVTVGAAEESMTNIPASNHDTMFSNT